METAKMTVIAKRSNKTIYRDGDKRIKVFDEDFSKADVLNEALNQARVEETGLDVPKIIEVTKIDGKWAIITEFIEGRTLTELMEKNPDKIDEYLNMFIDLQMKVHSKRCPKLNKLKDKMNAKISETKYDASIRYELHTRLEGMPKHIKVCHGDFTPGNIIVKEDGRAYIIDWSHATQGNAAADAARTYLRFCVGKYSAWAEKYLKLYCKKSDTAIQYVQRWMPIVAASESVKNKPGEAELLDKWVNVVEYE